MTSLPLRNCCIGFFTGDQGLLHVACIRAHFQIFLVDFKPVFSNTLNKKVTHVAENRHSSDGAVYLNTVLTVTVYVACVCTWETLGFSCGVVRIQMCRSEDALNPICASQVSDLQSRPPVNPQNSHGDHGPSRTVWQKSQIPRMSAGSPPGNG